MTSPTAQTGKAVPSDVRVCFWVKVIGAVPSRIEVSDRVGHVARHADHDGPLAAQVLDHDGGQEHGGDDDGGVDDAQRSHAHPLLCIQAALLRRDEGVQNRDVKKHEEFYRQF